jgi:hypothetical protein
MKRSDGIIAIVICAIAVGILLWTIYTEIHRKK